MPNNFFQIIFYIFWSNQKLVMISAVMFGCLPRQFKIRVKFIWVSTLLKTNRKSLYFTAVKFFHRPQNRAGIHAAGKKDTHRPVGNQLFLNRVAKKSFDLFFCVIIR